MTETPDTTPPHGDPIPPYVAPEDNPAENRPEDDRPPPPPSPPPR